MESVKKDLCTKIGCTTCGAQEFRGGLLVVLAQASNTLPTPKMNRNTALQVARALANVQPAEDQSGKFEEAVRLVLFEIWYTVGEATAERELESVLVGSWAGGVLARMKEHYRARMEARRRHNEENSPERITQSREEKQRLRQQKHAERLVRKKERDQLWREKHSGA